MCQEKSCVQAALMKVSIDHLLDNLELGKINYCFGKKSGKVLNFGSKNLYKPCYSQNQNPAYIAKN